MWSRAYTRPRTQREFTGIPNAVDGLMNGWSLPGRSGTKHGTVNVTESRSLTHSAVWACRRIRADLISTFPVDVFRKFGSISIEMPKPPIMIDPGGVKWDYVDWMWASQNDLDSAGNAVGIIRARNGARNRYYPDGLPAEIELADTRGCSVVTVKGKTKYRVDGKLYDPSEVYHEKAYPVSGSPVGLSVLQMAAATIGEALTMQTYGLDWFRNGGIPKAWMQNTAKRLQDGERDAAKQWYQDTISNGDLMVTGRDWEYNMIQAESAGMEWLEGRRFSVPEICRFYSVPPEMVHGAVSGQSITYANVSQANLQFLIMHLGPAIVRREKNLSKLLPEPRFVKMNTSGLLRMDDAARQTYIRSQLETWQLTLAEARELDNREPLSAADITAMQEIYGLPQIGRNAPAPAAPAPSESDPTEGADPAPAEQDPTTEPAERIQAWTPDQIRSASDFAFRREALAELTAV